MEVSTLKKATAGYNLSLVTDWLRPDGYLEGVRMGRDVSSLSFTALPIAALE